MLAPMEQAQKDAEDMEAALKLLGVDGTEVTE